MSSEALQAVTSVGLLGLLKKCCFPSLGSRVVCAVSGGADSSALLVLARAHGLVVEAVHVDHGLREGSEREATVVAELAERYGASFRSEKVVLAEGADLEQRARLARQKVLGLGALTGHTADDQAETVLINLLRGAGPAGLAGMKTDARHPLLALRRSETVELCEQLSIRFVNDPSNKDPRFVRNRVRSEVLPLLSDVSSRDMVPLLCRTAELQRRVVDDVAERSVGYDATDTKVLQHLPALVCQHVLREWLRDVLDHPPSAAEIDRIMAVVRHEVVACEIAGGRRISRSKGVLRVETQNL